MKQAVLLTGKPGCGKTTVIRRVVARLEIPAGGFYTQELRHAGQRVGFEIVTLDGQHAVLAHVDIRSKVRVGKYGVDLQTLEEVGVGALRAALVSGGLVVIDEIGPMEIASPRFRELVLDLLESPSTGLLGSIVHRSMPFSDAIKRRPNVILIEVTHANRDALPTRILQMHAST